MSEKDDLPSPYSDEKLADYLAAGGTIYKCNHGESEWLALNERKEKAKEKMRQKFGEDK